MNKSRLSADSKTARILPPVAFGCIFLLMLYCNIKTPMLFDDYGYCFSFADGARIESVSQIFPSMAAHRLTMNGRVISHFLLQLFLMLPTMVFKVLNSLMFVAMLAIICKLAFLNKEHPVWFKTVTIFAVFAAIWVFQPVFGDAFLWKAGSVNYLWTAVISLLYTYLCVASFCTGREPRGVVAVTAFLLLSLIAGAYSETCAITTIVASFLFAAQTYFFKKRKPSKLMVASFTLLLIGFAFLLFAPAEGANKLTGSLDAVHVLVNIKTIVYLCKNFWHLIAATVILLVVAIYAKGDKDTLHVVVTLLIIAVTIMLSLSVAYYVPERVLTMPSLLLVTVCAILVVELFGKISAISVIAQVLPILASLYFLAWGVSDIIQMDFQVRMNEQIIMADVEAGNPVSNVEILKGLTKYTPLYGSGYVSANPDNWQNISMSKYFGIDQIIGVKYE